MKCKPSSYITPLTSTAMLAPYPGLNITDMRFISHHEIEQRLVGDGVEVVIIGEFSMRDFISPGTRVASAEDLKVDFNFLVDIFCFAIRLEVISGGEGEVIVEHLSKLLHKGGGKLWTLIRGDFVIESKVEVDFVEKESSYSFCGDGFLNGAENYLIYKTIVNHDQQGVKARGNGEVGDKVARDLLEGVLLRPVLLWR